MFPGQGAQAVGMGQSFSESSDVAKERFQQADAAIDLPLSEICFNGPIEKLTETAITQPALLTVSVIAFELWKEKNDASSVVVGAGHSLGEYSALVAAGALGFEDAVKLVHNRGKFMQEAVPVGEGGMVAILGKEIEELASAVESAASTVEIANINAPGQVVLAGSKSDIQSFMESHSDWKMKELPVSAPFHCALMKKAEESLAPLVREVEIKEPGFPIVQNVTATPTTDPETIRENLIAQVCGSVRWVECMEKGISEFSPSEAVEFGSGKVLSGLLKRIQKGFPSKTIGTPEDLAPSS